MDSHYKRRSAFTLIEVLVDFVIIALVTLAVISAYMASLKSINLAKAKIAAVAIANEKMETLRNMPYDQLATEHGPIYPPGDILDTESVIRKGIEFNAKTTISCVDDPFDGSAPADKNACDYKKMEITVSKQGRNGYLSRLSSNVAAKAAETDSNTGIIKICVVDSGYQPVAGADIRIENQTLTPPLDISVQTGLDGCIMAPNLPLDDHNHYHLTATKSGYSTDSTSPRTPQNPNASQPDVNVLSQQITNQTFVIDKLSKMTLRFVDEQGANIGNLPVHIEGAKTLYTNPLTKKYSSDLVTDSNGEIELNNMEFDDYTVVINNYYIVTSSPYQPIHLEAEAELAAEITVTGNQDYPRIANIEPLSGHVGEITSITINGDNFTSGLSVKLINASGGEIVGTNATVFKHGGQESTIEADFNLTGAATGFWDIVVTNPDGVSIRQKNGFEVR